MTDATARQHQRNLLGLEGLEQESLLTLLAEAGEYQAVARRESPPLDTLRGRIIANLFFEDSTRTRCSFAVAAARLGAQTVDLTSTGSSVSKGETYVDTARTIEAMGVDAIVVRSKAAGAPAMIASAVACPVINAGDGRHEHPTQGLLDLLTLQQYWRDFDQRTIAIVGDIANSRVARSNLHGLTTLGAHVVLVGPPNLAPGSMATITRGPGSVTVNHDLDSVIESVDAIMMLRVQFERHAGSGLAGDYREFYGLSAARAARLKPDAPIMHPGPVNRGLEIDPEVADDPDRSIIVEQVTNGVAVRMAVLMRSLA